MSIKLMTVVWELDLPPGEKLVLLALADQANDDGRNCWPAVSTIGRRSGQGERTVRRAIADLEKKGHLTRCHRGGASTQYHVHPCQNGTPAKMAPLPKTTLTPANLAPKPLRTTISLDTDVSKQRARDLPVKIQLPDWIPKEAWDGWIAQRKKKPTPRAIELAIGKLEKLRHDGHDPGAVLDQSTFREWTGLFPVRDDDNGRRAGIGMGGHRGGGQNQSRTLAAGRAFLSRGAAS